VTGVQTCALPISYLTLEANSRRYPLAGGLSWAIGRGDGCAVMLDSRSVSRLHALIQKRDGGDFSLVDLGSRNGSFLNSRRVCIPQVLHDHDRLLFGDQELVFSNPSPSTSAAPPATDTRNAPTTSLQAQMMTTIVVVDIRDYTPLARSIPEPLLAQALGTWFLKVGQITQRLGSWAQRYIGDAVMAVWVHDDPAKLHEDVWGALRAVSEIETATTEISRNLPLPGPLRIGAGINTGTATVGSSEFTAIGDTVNAAFRLEAATKALGMGVVLGEGTFAGLGVGMPLPFVHREIELKGYEHPTVTWSTTFEQLHELMRTHGQSASAV